MGESQQAQQSATKIDIAELSSRLLESAPPLGPGKLIVADIPGTAADQLLRWSIR